MAGPETFNPAVLKPVMKTSGGDLKPSLVTSAYSGGTPGAGDLKPSLLKANSDLKESLLSGGSLKSSISDVSLASVLADAIGYWPLQDDAASTTVIDEGTGANNGVLTGAGNTSASSVAGPNSSYLKALSFDGVDDYVDSIGELGDFSFIQNTVVFSFAFWLKVDSTTGRYWFIGNSDSSSRKGIGIAFENGAGSGTRAISCFLTKGTVGNPVVSFRTADNAIADTNWHHVVIQHTAAASDSAAIYVDGVAQSITYANAFSAVSTGDSTYPFKIGGQLGALTTLELDGALAGVGLWDRALSLPEIIALGS